MHSQDILRPRHTRDGYYLRKSERNILNLAYRQYKLQKRSLFCVHAHACANPCVLYTPCRGVNTCNVLITRLEVSVRRLHPSIWRPLGPSFTDAHKFSRSFIFGDCRPIMETFEDLKSTFFIYFNMNNQQCSTLCFTLQHSSILEGNLLTRLLESLTLTSIPLQSEPLRALSSSFRGETDVFSYTKNLGWVENTPLLDTAPLHLALELRK